MGFYHRLFDLLDERLFTKGEVREFCLLLFGQDAFDSVPDPEVDWDGFYNALNRIVDREKEQWDPIHRKPKKLIDMKKLHKAYGSSCSCIIT